MNTIILSSDRQKLSVALAAFARTATVEAEYGDHVVEGSVLTLAHHGPRSANPPPCLYAGAVVEVEAIGLSHVDLDALGGVLAIQGRRPGPLSFWRLAGQVDVGGPHRLESFGPTDQDRAALHAFWAWSQANRLFAPRDGSVVDAGAWVEGAASALERIFAGDTELLAAGRAMAEQEAATEAQSFVCAFGVAGVLVRQSEHFVNHLYSHEGVVHRAVVAHNTKTGAITLSWESPADGAVHPARDLVQAEWGPEAGGHAGIAGSPRSGSYELADAVRLAERVSGLIRM